MSAKSFHSSKVRTTVLRPNRPLLLITLYLINEPIHPSPRTRFAFVQKLEVAGPSGRVAMRACKQNAWRTSIASSNHRALANASVSHWPFVCRPHREYANWGGLAHLFGYRSYQEVLLV